MRDPYEVLGLAKNASAADIKSAYRKLAKKFHPDQSKEPRAKDRFAEINSAYEIAGDEKTRAATINPSRDGLREAIMAVSLCDRSPP
jgi:curved DNA-binding protein CbpA